MSPSWIELVFAASALSGLAVVILEIARTDPGLFKEIGTDVEAMARRPLPSVRTTAADGRVSKKGRAAMQHA